MIITEKNNPLIPCARCGKNKHATELYYFNGESGYCVDCFIGAGIGRVIIEHNYKPMPVFCHLSTEKEDGKVGISKINGKGVKKDHRLLYMGIELEIESKTANLTRYAYEIQKEYPIYVKHDGSLQGGFEIVSHPQTAKYHQKVFNWYKLLEQLRKDKFTSYDNTRCGLHIHVNKNFFNGKDDILKVVLFFYKCFSKIKRFARRNKLEYCRKWELSLVNAVNACKGSVDIAENNNDRYTCVNLQNRNTVEFRIYRGTLNYDRFLSSILFTDAVCFFAKSYSIAFFSNNKHTGVILWKKFIEFIQKNDRYEFLKKYFIRHKLDSSKTSTDSLPIREDYLGKGHKIVIKKVSNLKDLVKGTGLARYIKGEISYDFVEHEFFSINFADPNSYFVVTLMGSPDFIVPRNIARVLLSKGDMSHMGIAKTIEAYLNTGEYIIRLLNESEVYKEVYGWSDLFANLNIYPENTGGFRDFIENTSFKYELIRSDVIYKCV